MKLKCFFIIAFLCFGKIWASSFFNKVDLFTFSDFSINSKNLQKNSLSYGTGFKLDFNYVNVCFYEKGVKDVLSLPTYGISLNLFEFLHFPFIIKAGTLLPGSVFTQFSSPQISYSKPLSNSFSILKGVTTSLPSMQSSKKENAFFTSIEFPPKSRFSSTGISFYFRDDKAFSLQGVVSAKLTPLTTFGFSFTGARFFLQNNDEAWFSDEPFFLPSWHAMFSSTTFFLSPFFASTFTTNVFCNNNINTNEDKKNASLSFKSDNKIVFGNMNIFLSAFVTDGVIHNSKNSFITNRFQLKFIPSYIFKLPNSKYSSIKVGGSFYSSVKEKEYFICDFKSALGFQYLSKNFSILFIGETLFDDVLKNKNIAYDFSSSVSFSKKNLSMGIKLNTSFSKDTSEEEISFSLFSKHKSVNTKTKIGISFKQKNAMYHSGNLEAQFTLNYLSKYIRYSAKIAASLKY